MNKKIYTLIMAVCLTANLLAQVSAPPLQWVKSILNDNTTNASAFCTAIASDAAGNVYITGHLTGSATLLGGPTLTSSGGTSTYTDFFVAKYNAAGVYQWSFVLGYVSTSETALDIKVDNNANIYICGQQQNSFDFDPGAGVTMAGSTGNNGYLAKYDQNGNFIWVKTFGACGYSIALDNFGHIYQLYGSGSYGGIKVQKYDLNGNTFTSIYCHNGSVEDGKIKTDTQGNVFVAQSFAGNLYSTGTFTLTYSGSGANIAVLKYDSTLTYKWSQKIGGSGTPSSPSDNIDDQEDFYQTNPSFIGANDIAIDNSGNPCVVGCFSTTVNFSPTTTLTSVGNDGYFAKYNSADGSLIYVKQLTNSPYYVRCHKVSIDANDYINIVGEMHGIGDFDPGAGTANLNVGGYGLFLAKYDGSGNYISAYGIFASSGATTPYGLYLDASNLYFCGAYSSINPRNFDMGAGTTNLTGTSIGNACGFFAKYNYCSVAPNQPAAVAGATALCAGAVQTYSIATVAGASSYVWSLPGGWSGTSTTNTISATAGSSGSLSVTANSSCGASTAQTLSVTVNAAPTLTVSGGAICTGQSFTISPSGANTYTYTGGSAVVTPTTNTTYTVTGTSSSGCVTSSSTAVTVTVNPLPTITVNSGAICSGSSFTMSPSGANTYTFSSGSAVVTPTANASYTVTGTSAQGCVSASGAVSSVSVNNIPAQPVSVDGNQFICTGTANTYSVATVSGATSYTWLYPTGWSGASTTNAINTTAGAASGNVSVTANNTCGNSTAQTVNITVLALPSVTAAAAPDSVCNGGSTTVTANGANTYVWNNGNTNTSQSVSPTTTTIYTVTGTDANNCVSTGTVSVKVNQLPTLTYNQNPNAVCSTHAPFTLSTGFPTGGTYSGLGVTGNTFNPSTAGTGTITITYSYTDAKGCSNSISKTIIDSTCSTTGILSSPVGEGSGVRAYPNPFSNEITVIASAVKQSLVSIYNMLGEKVHEFTLDNGKQTINLESLAPGVYYLQVTGKTIKIVKQ